jgi:hypothetical protein
MDKPLFHREGELRHFFEIQKQSIKREIEDYEKKLLSLNEEELLHYLIDTYSLVSPVLREEEMYISGNDETDVDVSRDPLRAIFDRDKPFYIKGISLSVAIPFDGNPNLFYFTPSSFNLSPPRGVFVFRRFRTNVLTF